MLVRVEKGIAIPSARSGRRNQEGIIAKLDALAVTDSLFVGDISQQKAHNWVNVLNRQRTGKKFVTRIVTVTSDGEVVKGVRIWRTV
jgi:hypothetical protein